MTILLASQRLRLYERNELDDVLQTMARQAASLLPPAHAALIGIKRRGEPLAQRLRQHIAHQTGQPELPLYPLEVKRYADDLQVLHPFTLRARPANRNSLFIHLRSSAMPTTCKCCMPSRN
ncbi:bifunctional pyrimidine regulatory protein PyrR uracil phosphoribosyltransferase [compost metagenome]